MADADREARINLKTVADTTGAQQTSQALDDVAESQKRVEQSAKAALKAADDLAKKQAVLRDAINGAATEFLQSRKEMEGIVTGAKATREALDGTQKSAERLRGFIKGLGFEFPQLARFLNFVTNPLTLVSAGLGMVAGKLLEVKARADEVLALRGKVQSFSDATNSLTMRAAEFAARVAVFESGLKRIAAAGGDAASRIDALTTAAARVRGFKEQLNDMALDLELKGLDGQLERKQLRPEEAAAQAAQLRQQRATEKAAADEFDISNQASMKHFAAMKTGEEIEAARARRPSPEALAAAEKAADESQFEASLRAGVFQKYADEGYTKIAGLEQQRENLLKRQKQLGPFASDAKYRGDIAVIDETIKGIKEDLARRLQELQPFKEKAAGAKRAFEGLQGEATRSDAEVQAGVQKQTDLLRKSKELEQELAALKDFNRSKLAILQQGENAGVAGTRFKAGQQRAQEDAEHWFKVYQEADTLPPGEREKFFERHLPSAPTRTRGSGSAGGGERGAMTGVINEGLKAAGGLEEVLELNKAMFAEINATIRTHKDAIEALNRRLHDLRSDPV